MSSCFVRKFVVSSLGRLRVIGYVHPHPSALCSLPQLLEALTSWAIPGVDKRDDNTGPQPVQGSDMPMLGTAASGSKDGFGGLPKSARRCGV